MSAKEYRLINIASWLGWTRSGNHLLINIGKGLAGFPLFGSIKSKEAKNLNRWSCQASTREISSKQPGYKMSCSTGSHLSLTFDLFQAPCSPVPSPRIPLLPGRSSESFFMRNSPEQPAKETFRTIKRYTPGACTDHTVKLFGIVQVDNLFVNNSRSDHWKFLKLLWARALSTT